MLPFLRADPKLMLLMADWLGQYAKVPSEKLRARIWIHDGLDEKKAKKFWCKISSTPLSQFIKTYNVTRKVDSKKIRKNIHPYGVLRVVAQAR